jgi:sarcosine oxidase
LDGVSRLSAIVVGLGAVGSSAALSLARAGVEVLGIDRWRPPHKMGSTHGESRITRCTAWEGAQYVPLVARANTLLRELATQTGHHYFDAIGGLFIGRPDDFFIKDSRASADATGLPYEQLTRDEIQRRLPDLRVPQGMVGFLDPGAGVLHPERIVEDQLAAAATLGARYLFNTEVLEFGPRGNGVFVRTAEQTLFADRLVLCAGAWMPELLAPIGVALKVERITLHWFHERADAPARAAVASPVLLVGDDHGDATAIFPTMNGRIKSAAHGSGAFTTAAAVDRGIHESDIAPVRELLQAWLPGRVGSYAESAVCLYTNTPDGHFILDRHPTYPQIVLGSPCNGFGFKFACASGEILAAFATDATPPVDPAPWRLKRFAKA